jgi:hypothetical protein
LTGGARQSAGAAVERVRLGVNAELLFLLVFAFLDRAGEEPGLALLLALFGVRLILGRPHTPEDAQRANTEATEAATIEMVAQGLCETIEAGIIHVSFDSCVRRTTVNGDLVGHQGHSSPRGERAA